MRTTVREDRLLIISDVHMGNPLHRPRQEFMNLVRFALDNRYSLCINGDGIDIAQLSVPRLTADLTPALALMTRFTDARVRIYYTVGNHDIALENFLNDLGWMRVVPFLNVYSGEKRMRVEHGHTYDAMFLRYPRTYFVFTVIGRLAIGISPKFYDFVHNLNHVIITFAEWMISGFGLRKTEEDTSNRIKGERKCFGDGAEDVGLHGFDAVIFGHTHLQGTVEFADGRRYYNTGGWFKAPWCVLVDKGQIWFGPVADLHVNPDPFPRPHDDDDDDELIDIDFADRRATAAIA
jgi:UDP-2,3-diacylglucosamine pyrophosphatase LpxH